MVSDSANGQSDEDTGGVESPEEADSGNENSAEKKSGKEKIAAPSSTFWGIVDRIHPRQAWGYAFGKTVCIFGPSRAGKTTLYKYIADDILPEVEQKSVNTVSFEWKRGVAVPYKRASGAPAKFWLKYVEDSAGDSEMDLILKETGDHRPNFIFFVFDATKPDQSVAWMKDFANAVKNSQLNKKVRAKLRGAAIVLNKCDRLDFDGQTNPLEKLKSDLLELLDEAVKKKTGISEDTVEVFTCCFLTIGKMPKQVGKSQHVRAVKYMAERVL
jgi:GTPase SAR1 family protein